MARLPAAVALKAGATGHRSGGLRLSESVRYPAVVRAADPPWWKAALSGSMLPRDAGNPGECQRFKGTFMEW